MVIEFGTMFGQTAIQRELPLIHAIEPAVFRLQKPVPQDFGGVLRDVRSQPISESPSALQMVWNQEWIEGTISQYGKTPQYTRIMRGPNGGVLFFHITKNPTEVERAIKNDRLQSQPSGDQSWLRRCFMNQLHTFTDIRLAAQRFPHGQINPEQLVVLETNGMESDYSVVLKQGLWNQAVLMIESVVRATPELNQALRRVHKAIVDPQNQHHLDRLTLQILSFQISAGMIDSFSLLHPEMSRMGYRDYIQKHLMLDGQPARFGFGCSTDPRFIEEELLLKTVDLVGQDLINKHLTTPEDMEITRAIIGDLLKGKYYFLDTIQVEMLKEGPTLCLPIRSILYRLAENNSEIHRLMHDLGLEDEDKILSQLCNGVNPFPFMAGEDYFNLADVSVGTDGGSNNVGLMRNFRRRTAKNPYGSRMIVGSEKIHLIDQLTVT